MFEHVNLYAATSEPAPPSNVRSDTVNGLHDIPLCGSLNGKLDSWTWKHVVEFLKTFWQARRHGSWDLAVSALGLSKHDQAWYNEQRRQLQHAFASEN